MGRWRASAGRAAGPRDRQLLAAMEREAQRLGFATIYCSTRGAQRLLERCGWESNVDITHESTPLSVYRKTTKPAF